MSILTEPLSTAEQKARAALTIHRDIKRAFEKNVRTHAKIAARVFADPDGLTPQQVLDGMGTAAGGLVSLESALRTFLNGLAPDTITDPLPYELTVNKDGTVTVGDPVE